MRVKALRENARRGWGAGLDGETAWQGVDFYWLVKIRGNNNAKPMRLNNKSEEGEEGSLLVF